jgi:selenocysteine lyase/cysteine desulfurase
LNTFSEYVYTCSCSSYQTNKEEREEGGSPKLIADVRLGLCMHVKQQIGATWIEQEERKVSRYIRERLSGDSRLVLLGQTEGSGTENYLPIVSFLIRYNGRFLHFNFVCALLNDLFGVQSRGTVESSCVQSWNNFLSWQVAVCVPALMPKCC